MAHHDPVFQGGLPFQGETQVIGLSCQEIPADTDRQKVLLRSLMNVRHPGAISKRFLEVQDAYLQGE